MAIDSCSPTSSKRKTTEAGRQLQKSPRLLASAASDKDALFETLLKRVTDRAGSADDEQDLRDAAERSACLGNC